VIVALNFLSPFFYYIPTPGLAALIASAVIATIDIQVCAGVNASIHADNDVSQTSAAHSFASLPPYS
jgi:MFS superfamily sulfate permease-like transporter